MRVALFFLAAVLMVVAAARNAGEGPMSEGERLAKREVMGYLDTMEEVDQADQGFDRRDVEWTEHKNDELA